MGKKEYLMFLGLVFELLGLVLGLVYAGHYFDQKMGYSGVGVAGGAVLALLIWVLHLVQAFKNLK
jgi:hypothetical protein